MAVVLLDDDYDPPSEAFYLRQVAWSQFNGTRLVPTTRSDLDRDIPQGYPTEAITLPERPPSTGRTLIHHTVALLTEHNNPFGIEGAFHFEPARNPNPARFVRAYRVQSLAQTIDYRKLFGRRSGHPQWTDEQRAYYLQGPTDPRYRQLAETIINRLPQARRNDPFAHAVAIKLWLDDHLTYTRRARHASAQDPTADMLWGDKRGYCVHFAHAAVFLWRSVGVHSRIGSGYHVDAQHRGSSSTIIVRSSDGHAWPELYLEGVGWIVLDIAPKRNEDPPGEPPDDEERDRLGQMAREQPPDPQQPPRRSQQPLHNTARAMAQTAAKAFPWLVLLALLAMYAVKLWRRFVPHFATGAALARVAYRAALDVLAEAGVVREYGETREAFARRVKDWAPSLEFLSHEAERVKLSGTDPDPPDTHKVRAALGNVVREVSNARPWWRRLLGALHPASWLDVK
jgi:transglutaminase-like putative cysteine protease